MPGAATQREKSNGGPDPKHNIEAAREENPSDKIAVVRLEQFYPFPGEALRQLFESYPKAKQFVWAQEEPQNMGGWMFVHDRVNELLPEGVRLRFVGRAPSASPATGSYAIHDLEQKEIVAGALNAAAEEVSAASEPEVSEKLAPAGA